MIIVNSFQPLTIITKRSILDVAAALDPLTIITKRSILDVTAALDPPLLLNFNKFQFKEIKRCVKKVLNKCLCSKAVIIVKKLRRKYYNQGMKCLATLSNAYFHAFCDNPFYQSFECIQRKYLTFNVVHMKIHHSIIGSLTPQHLAMLRHFLLFSFFTEKIH